MINKTNSKIIVEVNGIVYSLINNGESGVQTLVLTTID